MAWIQFALGVVMVGASLVLSTLGVGLAPAIPLLFIGGCLTMAGLVGIRGGSLEGLVMLGMSDCPHCARPTARNAPICKHCGGRLG